MYSFLKQITIFPCHGAWLLRFAWGSSKSWEQTTFRENAIETLRDIEKLRFPTQIKKIHALRLQCCAQGKMPETFPRDALLFERGGGRQKVGNSCEALIGAAGGTPFNGNARGAFANCIETHLSKRNALFPQRGLQQYQRSVTVCAANLDTKPRLPIPFPNILTSSVGVSGRQKVGNRFCDFCKR